MDSDGDRGRNPRHDRDPFASLHDSIDKSINSLFATIISLPTAIYHQGSEHGREWTRSMQNHQPHVENEDASADAEHCPYLPHPRGRGQQAERTLTGNSETEEMGNDWISSILRQMNLDKTKARDVCPYFQQDEASATAEAMAANADAERGSPPLGSYEECVDTRERSQAATQSVSDLWKQMDRLQTHLSQSMNSLQKEIFGSGAHQADDAQDRGFWPFPSILSEDLPLAQPLSNLFAIGLSPAFLHFRPEATVAGYLLFSNYSPLALESQQGFDKQWRSRFEDLLRVQSGQEMMAAEDRAEASSGAGINWFTRRVAPVLRQHGGSEHHEMYDDDDNNDDELTASDIQRFVTLRQVEDAVEGLEAEAELQTEEAAYNRLQMHRLRSHQNGGFPPSSIASHIPPGTFTSNKPDRNPSTSKLAFPPLSPSPTILPSFTRTETYQSPDGTVTTQKVLRETLFDGRQQVTETTEKVRGEDREVNTRTYSIKSGSKSGTPKEIEMKQLEAPTTKRGWFWNS